MYRKFRVYLYTDPDDPSSGPVLEFLFAKAAKDHARQCVESGEAYKAKVLSPDGVVIRRFERPAPPAMDDVADEPDPQDTH